MLAAVLFDLDGTLVDTLPVVLPDAWPSALPPYFEEYERLLPMCPAVVPELGAALALLRERGIPTALVTGKSHVTATMSLRHSRLDGLFDAVEPGSPEGVVKAAAIRRLLERGRLRPENAVYVGDGAADMLAAREAGVIAAGAAWAHGARVAELKEAQADLIFTDAAEFLAWVDGKTRRVRRG